MQTTLHRQTKAPLSHARSFSLPMLQVSPYFSIGRGALVQTKMIVKFVLHEYMAGANGLIFPYGSFKDISTDTYLSTFQQQFDASIYDTKNDLVNAVYAAVVADAATKSYTGFVVTDIQDMASGLDSSAIVAAYQTIVSQTGTAAPAVGGSLVPTSTYASGTTFTWARTSAGVYTLTASTAVFNTSGKTAVILGPLNNLNGQYTAVVTSSTVITITTAVQSLAVLGLLGFTATPTDAMMTKTAVQVLTYA